MCVLLTEPTQTVSIGSTCAPWVFANAGGKGYYRTAYPPEAIKAIAADVGSALSAPERLSLLSDEWALVRAGRHSVADYLELASGFGHEPIAQVLGVAADRLAFVDEYLTSAANKPAFRGFVLSLLQPAYRTIGFDRHAEDSEDRRSLRNVIVGALGLVAEDPDVVVSARRSVDAALAGTAALDPILATTLVNIAASKGDAALFGALAKAATDAVTPQDHYRYLYALTSFTEPSLVARALEHIRSSDLRSQDAALYLGSFFGNPAARDSAWAFLKQHWTEIAPKITIAGGDVNVVSSLSAFCSAGARDDIRSFFAAHPLPAAARALRQTFERIENCIRTSERQQPAVSAWLAQRHAGPAEAGRR
jgi:aminopeptidase N/puromycin-sensitive aminopeptidase